MQRQSEPSAPQRTRLLGFRRPLIWAAVVCLALVSYFSAFFLRADFTVPDSWRGFILRSIPFLLAARLVTFYRYGFFQGWWTGAGMPDFLDVVKAVAAGSALFVASLVLAFGVYAVPRSVVLIDAILLIGLLSGSRLLSRLWARSRDRPRTERTLVIGRLPSLERLLREVIENPEIPLRPVALIDLNGGRPGLRIHGVPIAGAEDVLPDVLASYRIGTVLLAISSREAATIRRILARCDHPSVRFRIVPPLEQVLSEGVQPRDLREVEIDDLLGRHELRFDAEHVREGLLGRRILITGAAGSIGSELARQIIDCGPREVVLLDRNEAALAVLANELRPRHPDAVLVLRLCDIRNRRRLLGLFEEHRPEIVYHAAAYKHVPMMEMNPTEAVKNNVLGTKELLDFCEELAVEKFVLISTDKAVNPSNIMGATKRVAELLIAAPSGSRCRRIAVRFGNVFGSDGSVVPILLRQIRDGGPVTVTHPDATRYFMTIPEAVQLLLQASVLGRGGELFVLDMGEPVRILDLATSLVRLAGLQPGRDIEIRITGLRPGERLHEETLIDSATRPTEFERIWMRPPEEGAVSVACDLPTLEALVERSDQEGVLRWLRQASKATPDRGNP